MIFQFGFDEPSVPEISVEQLMQAIEDNTSCIILDVRTPGEFERGHIEGSVNIPVDCIDSTITSTLSDTSKRMYVYCLSGSRSAHAVEALISLGYKNIFNVSHGLLAWRAKYYPLVT
jgi:rhodanese-related sulfurtransferase